MCMNTGYGSQRTWLLVPAASHIFILRQDSEFIFYLIFFIWYLEFIGLETHLVESTGWLEPSTQPYAPSGLAVRMGSGN